MASQESAHTALANHKLECVLSSNHDSVNVTLLVMAPVPVCFLKVPSGSLPHLRSGNIASSLIETWFGFDSIH